MEHEKPKRRVVEKSIDERLAFRKDRDAKRPIDLKKAGRCGNGRQFRDKKSGRVFVQRCGHCLGCRMEKHEGLVGGAIAESLSSSVVISMTLTYADVVDETGQKVAPSGAVRLDYSDIEKLMKKLRKKFDVRKICAGEYGSKDGRAHWHILLFFQWDKTGKEAWKADFVKGLNGSHYGDHLRTCPAYHVGYLKKPEFVKMLADEKTLLCTRAGGVKGLQKPRQSWGFWPHGLVEAQIIKDPFIIEKMPMNAAIRYVIKYLTKDPWKDSKKYCHKAFEELPEWVKQSTNYSRPNGKWFRRNWYREELERSLLSDFGSDMDIPVERLLFKHKYNYTCKGGLGVLYFEALGRFRALSGVQFLDRSYRIEGIHKPTSKKDREAALRRGESPKASTKKLFEFYMKEAAFKTFGKAFNAEFERLGKDAVTGKTDRDELESVFDRADNAKDYASGAFGYVLWKKAKTRKQRLELVRSWGEMPNENLKGLVPARWILWFEINSRMESWQKKRHARLLAIKKGKVTELYAMAKPTDKIYVTDSGKVMFERSEKNGNFWWDRELKTVEHVELALAGELPPEHAFAVRIEKEGKGDLRRLADFDKRTIRKLLDKK